MGHVGQRKAASWLKGFTFLRPEKVPMRVSQRPSRPDTPRKRDLPRKNALLRRRTYDITSSCMPQPAILKSLSTAPLKATHKGVSGS